MQLRYSGCLTTPPLWHGDGVSPYRQITLSQGPEPLESASFNQYRLGKLAEAFVFHALKKESAVSWICDNLQVQQEKRTVGEIDALFYENGKPVHLEVSYKFYLYDTLCAFQNPLAPWIGPNRKDNLVLKLQKLHQKQFPLLHTELAAQYLDRYGLAAEEVEQTLCFKGQLFLPDHEQNMDIGPLNQDCIAGIYLSFSELQKFQNREFFIPLKPDWLIKPHHDVAWLSYTDANAIIKAQIDEKRSPMAWVRDKYGEIIRCFIVFW